MIELVQGSPEWIAARVGSLGASRVGDATAKTAGGKWGASRANVMGELLAERLTGVPFARFVTKEMTFGSETEPQARAAYEFLHDVTVETCGIFRHPTIAGTHASPDGLVGDDGLIEIKVPNVAGHIDFLLSDEVDLRYRKQMCWQLLCTGRTFCDFVSFSPEMPFELQLRTRRFELKALLADKQIGDIEGDVKQFLADLAAKEDALRIQMTQLEDAA
jgi:hypothetical protein